MLTLTYCIHFEENDKDIIYVSFENTVSESNSRAP